MGGTPPASRIARTKSKLVDKLCSAPMARVRTRLLGLVVSLTNSGTT